MSENDCTYKRWYDEDEVVSKCVALLESIPDSAKRKTATYLMDELIISLPQKEILPENIFEMITSETRKRRWYDFDEVMRIFLEAVRHSEPETRKQTAINAIRFIEDLMPVR